MIGKKNRGKTNSDVILVARLLEEHGYEIRAVKQGGKGGALTVKVLPPILSEIRRTGFGTEPPDPGV